jgi:uncharacterized protein with HEPN domain
MSNEDDARLKHIVDAAEEIKQFLTNKTEAQFRGDRLLLLGIQKLIEIIGEAANQLSDSLKQQYPHIGWRSAASTRNRLSHGYFDIDAAVIWSTATQDVPRLAEQVRSVVEVRSSVGRAED